MGHAASRRVCQNSFLVALTHELFFSLFCFLLVCDRHTSLESEQVIGEQGFGNACLQHSTGRSGRPLPLESISLLAGTQVMHQAGASQ